MLWEHSPKSAPEETPRSVGRGRSGALNCSIRVDVPLSRPIVWLPEPGRQWIRRGLRQHALVTPNPDTVTRPSLAGSLCRWHRANDFWLPPGTRILRWPRRTRLCVVTNVHHGLTDSRCVRSAAKPLSSTGPHRELLPHPARATFCYLGRRISRLFERDCVPALVGDASKPLREGERNGNREE